MVREYSNAWAATFWWIEYRNQERPAPSRIDPNRKNGTMRNGSCVSVFIARDDRTLEVVRRGEQMLFQDWAAFFLERTTPSPPIRAARPMRLTKGRSVTSSTKPFAASGGWLTSPQTKSSSIFVGGSSSTPGSRLVQVSRNYQSVEANHGAPGVSGASADTQCRCAEEIASGQSLRGCRVPCLDQRSVPSALRRVVGATVDRIPCS